jgi:hypothetical protein
MKTDLKPISKLKRVFSWLDENALLVLTGFLIAFIPLYPKLPLAELIEGYIVRVRLEDFLILFATGIWFLQVIRRKIPWKTPLTFIIGMYLVAGLLSCISALFWIETVPLADRHVLKLFLHYFRRVEYFSLFFIAFASVKTRLHLKILLTIFAATALLVGVYGVGQKYLYWPVYSTMNREFSKGLQLYLTEHARVQSTFGGHYDFAAYLVIALPLILSLMTLVKKRVLHVGLGGAFLVGLWGLMMTSSRSSFLAYVAAIFIFFFLFAFKKGILWALSRATLVLALTAVFMVFFGDLLTRFGQIFKDNSAYLAIQDSVNQAKEIAQAPIIDAPQNGISIDDMEKAAAEAAKLAQVIDSTDTLPVPVTDLPPDVYEDIPAKVIRGKNEYGKDVEVVIPRVFSENAHRLGLSAAIRLDTLWPFAIRGFLRNPLLGSGYSTLTKYTFDEFTDAESTDNDFLRTLGETGLFGFLTFYGSMITALVIAWKAALRLKDRWLHALTVGFTAITIGLFINAVYIDVFVSSKVIQTYWMIAGLILAYATILKRNATESVPVQPVKVVRRPKKK